MKINQKNKILMHLYTVIFEVVRCQIVCERVVCLLQVCS